MINWWVEIIENVRVIFYYQTRNILLLSTTTVCTDTAAAVFKSLRLPLLQLSPHSLLWPLTKLPHSKFNRAPLQNLLLVHHEIYPTMLPSMLWMDCTTQYSVHNTYTWAHRSRGVPYQPMAATRVDIILCWLLPVRSKSRIHCRRSH